MIVIRDIAAIWFLASAVMLGALIGRYVNRKRRGEFNGDGDDTLITINPRYMGDSPFNRERDKP